jgi:dihydrofolate reductase
VPGPVSVFIASSLDGFIAGPGDDMSWLPQSSGEDYGFDAYMAATAALLMGRSTYDVVAGFEGWPYGDTPVFVATTRPLEPAAPTVRAVAGEPAALLAALGAAGIAGGVYVDGGTLIRQFLDAGLIDEATITVIPVILGAGAPLFAGAARRRELELLAATPFPSGLVQLRYRMVSSSGRS